MNYCLKNLNLTNKCWLLVCNQQIENFFIKIWKFRTKNQGTLDKLNSNRNEWIFDDDFYIYFVHKSKSKFFSVKKFHEEKFKNFSLI